MEKTEIGFCHCGCGQKTKIAKNNDNRYGRFKGEPNKYLRNHSPNKGRMGAKNNNWKGGKSNRKDGVTVAYLPNHPRAHQNGYVPDHILAAEKALGKSLPPKAVIHHHTPQQLVLCESQAYHMLLHRRMRALKACVHADWRKCPYCKQYDDPLNLINRGGGQPLYHLFCNREDSKARYKRVKEDTSCGGFYP
jgi:hypothetical protein